MPKKDAPPLQGDLLQGTLDLLILQTLVLGAAHGHTIAHVIEHRSEDVLQVEHGSLYPALHRLHNRGWIAAFWGTSENNRKAKYYRLTCEGKKQLARKPPDGNNSCAPLVTSSIPRRRNKDELAAIPPPRSRRRRAARGT